MKVFLVAWSCLLLSCISSAGTISLTADTTPPDPNEEITVWVHTDEPLLFMGLGVYVNGDATITSAMSEADCNDFGWETGWGFEPIIDEPNGCVSIGGVCWAADANDIVGYFKFRYHSGQVAVYIDQESSIAGNWDSNFIFSDETLLFGEIELPPLREPNEPTAIFMQNPAGSSGSPRGEMDSFAGWSQRIAMLSEGGSEPNVIEINSDITTNQVWDANNVYYIADANGVDVQALLVIEPGVTVIMGYQCGLFVNNGGTLIAKGTPDKPILFTPDYMYYDYRDYIGYYWQALPSYGPYYCSPIYIQDTASPATTIRHCMIEGAIGGIVTDNIRLANPIENNYLFGNIYGILEYGPRLTDIRNNLCFYNDQAGIEAYLEPDPNALPDTENPFTIEQNTCDSYQYCGITVHGAADPNQAPTVYLLNNIVSSNYWYGLNLIDGYMQMIAVNTGYYDNSQNKNWEFDEYNPVIAEEFPYASVMGEKPYNHHYLAPDSDFINAGSQYIEQTTLIGMTTDANSTPDIDVVDLGFHHMDWDYVGGEGIADTDIDDLITLADYWLCYTPFDPSSPGYIDPNLYIYDPNHPENWIDPNTIHYGGDWNDNGFVDLADFAILAGLWQAASDEPNIIPIISGDPATGWINVTASGVVPTTTSVSVYLDGMYMGKIYNFTSDALTSLDVEISEFGNTPQQLKLIALDSNGQITCSDITDATFPSPLNYCILPHSYEPNEPILFSAYNTNEGEVSVKVYANGGQLVWSQSFIGNTITGSIPASVAMDHRINFVKFEPANETSVMKGTAESAPLLQSLDPAVTGLIVIGSLPIYFSDFRTLDAVETAFRNRGVKCRVLLFPFDTWGGIAKYAPQLKYLYIDAHGAWSVALGNEGVPRTFVTLSDGPCVSAKASDFIGTAPIWCRDPLPGYLEDFAKSFITMGFTDLRLFYNDSCLGGHLTIGPHTGTLVEGRSGQQGLLGDIPHNDMSIACGMTSLTEDRFYQGWDCESESFMWPSEETSFQKFSRLVWESLGEGHNYYEALNNAITGQTEFGSDSAVQNYRVKGQTFLWEVRLSSN